MNNYSARDGIARAYNKNSQKRFMQWFNCQKPELKNVPEVALCDEIFIHNEKDYQDKAYIIDLLEVGESCVVQDDICIITRVK